MEVRAGIEPANGAFAELGLTTWLPHHHKFPFKFLPPFLARKNYFLRRKAKTSGGFFRCESGEQA